MIANLIASNNINLLNNKQNAGGGRKTEEQKAETSKKIVVRKKTTALFLQNNPIRTIENLRETLNDVMFFPDNLQWIDISNCHLENIEPEFANFRQLKILYLHGNYFS